MAEMEKQNGDKVSWKLILERLLKRKTFENKSLLERILEMNRGEGTFEEFGSQPYEVCGKGARV